MGGPRAHMGEGVLPRPLSIERRQEAQTFGAGAKVVGCTGTHQNPGTPSPRSPPALHSWHSPHTAATPSWALCAASRASEQEAPWIPAPASHLPQVCVHPNYLLHNFWLPTQGEDLRRTVKTHRTVPTSNASNSQPSTFPCPWPVLRELQTFTTRPKSHTGTCCPHWSC